VIGIEWDNVAAVGFEPLILEHKCRAQIKKLLCGWHPQLKKKIKN